MSLHASFLNAFRNEQCAFVVTPNQPKIQVWVHDYKAIGRDKLLGAGEIDVSLSHSWGDFVSHVVL